MLAIISDERDNVLLFWGRLQFSILFFIMVIEISLQIMQYKPQVFLPIKNIIRRTIH